MALTIGCCSIPADRRGYSGSILEIPPIRKNAIYYAAQKGNARMSTPGAATQTAASIKPATGKLGIMTAGMGAVCTTLIAGVEAVRKGLAKPIGSQTQMGTIRLGKRTDANSPLHQGLCAHRQARRPGLYRLGHLRRQPVRRGQDRAGAGPRPARPDSPVSSSRLSRCPRSSTSTTSSA